MGTISRLDDLLRTTEDVATAHLAPMARRTDREGRWNEEGIRSLQAAGLGGLVVPVSAGGHGLGLLAVARVVEVLSRSCPSTALAFGMHQVATAVISARATPRQCAEFLVPIAEGRHLTTLALSEPGTGSHFYVPETRGRPRDDGGFEISGNKAFVTNGGHADSYVVSVAGDETAGPGEFSCLVVPGTASGLTWGEPWAGWGMRGNSARNVNLDATVVERDHLLGREGDQIWYVFHVVAPYFLMAMSGCYLGVAASALDEALRHLRSRVFSHSGKSLARSSVIQHRVGELWAEVERTRALVYDAAARGDAGADDALPALCSAKAEVAGCAEHVAAEAMTLLGGQGYAEDAFIHQMYRDARAAHVMSPTTDILRLWTGRFLLGLPLLGD